MPNSPEPTKIVNALSVDVEDYFHVSAFERYIPREAWVGLESRVESNTARVLELFSQHDVKATMFVLGWVAERWPQLVLDICSEGHELALHGYDHRRVTSQTPDEFRADVRKSKAVLEKIAGTAVVGYRAPTYSIVEETLWALDILSEEGFLYDSSIFPVHHDRYGIPDAPRFPHKVSTRNGGHLIEFPISTLRVAGRNLPFLGGGYMRHFPPAIAHWGMRRLNRNERQPAIVYVHPWEIDPDQPRIKTSRLTAFRHYRNLNRTLPRLDALLSEFPFTTVRGVLGV